MLSRWLLQIAHMGRPGVTLDFVTQIAAPAESKQRLCHHEHRADEQADQVVDKGWLAALVVVADELKRPPQNERAQTSGQALASASGRHLVS